MKRKKIPLPFSLIGFLLLIPSIVLNIYLISRSQQSQGIQVVEVLDGDTILIDQKVRVRLRHIDAPELKFCGGRKAHDLLTSLVNGKQVRLEEEIRDQFGRPLALIYIGDTLINEKMLESGWVRYHHDKSTKEKELKALSDQRKEERVGIYSDLCYQTENTENPECNIKGNIDKSSKAKKYYVPNCAQYKFTIIEKDIGESWFCTEKEAQDAGYIHAETCK